ncbi:unnamed protein product [Closterium sp. Naga37s-1]|nr:unnamed protein product [Closterium sp. Naga37s-1]
MVLPTSPSPSSPSSSGSADELASLLEAELEDVRVDEGDEEADDEEQGEGEAEEAEAEAGEAEDGEATADAIGDTVADYDETDAADTIEDEAMREVPAAGGDDSPGGATTGPFEPRKGLDEDGGGKRRRMCGGGASEGEASAVLGAGGKDGRETDRERGASAASDGRGSGGKGGKERKSSGCPPHPGFMWGVCIRCGILKERAEADEEAGEERGAGIARGGGSGGVAVRGGPGDGVREKPPKAAADVAGGVALKYIHHALEVSAEEAARMVGEERARMERRRRLYLVLDLDHTLLNSARDIDVPPAHEAYLAAAYTIGGVPPALPPALPPAAPPAGLPAGPHPPPAVSPPASLATPAAPAAAASPPAPPAAAAGADAGASGGAVCARAAEATGSEAPAPSAATGGQPAGAPVASGGEAGAAEPAAEQRERGTSTGAGTGDNPGTAPTAAATTASPASTPAAPPPITLFRLPHIRMWTKLRPGIASFLQRAHDLFDLVVYTNGERAYAHAMAALLDPTGRLFGGRVISHGDSTVRGLKDLDVVLGADSMVLILDDSEVVWPKHRHNLLLVERYHFFASSRQHFLLPGPSLLESHVDEADEGGLLDALWTPLSRTHQWFFQQVDQGRQSADVRQILAQERATILAGCHLVFSRVFPTDASRPQTHPLWRMAESMGATCHTQIGPQITHVVALDCGTDKAIWAVSQKRHLVHPGWLEASLLVWKRADEKKFPVDWGKGRAGWCPSIQVVATVPMPANGAAVEGVGVAAAEKDEETNRSSAVPEGSGGAAAGEGGSGNESGSGMVGKESEEVVGSAEAVDGSGADATDKQV